MLGLPESTEVRKVIHKKVLYNKFEKELSSERRKNFDVDISRITIMNEISPVSLNLKEGNEIKSIYVVLIRVKNEKVDERNLMFISKLFGQHMLLVLEYHEKIKIVVYQTIVLQTEWMIRDNFIIKLNGLDLDKVWESIVVQISGIEIKSGNTLNEQIEIERDKERLLKQMDILEKQARTEKQPKKKFEIFQRINEYKMRMDELK